MASTNQSGLVKPQTDTDIETLKALNLQMWDRVHSLELQVQLELDNKKRSEKIFKKKLARLAKYLDLRGHQASSVQSKLTQMATGVKPFNQNPNTFDSQASEEEDLRYPILPLKKKRTKQQSTVSQKPIDPEATESDSAFEDISQSKVPLTTDDPLRDYLTFGELAGKIPNSLLPKVDFQAYLNNNNIRQYEEEAVALTSSYSQAVKATKEQLNQEGVVEIKGEQPQNNDNDKV